MQVWNVLHAACWKYRAQKIAKNLPSACHCTTLSGYILTTKACIDNRKKIVKQQYLLHMFSQYGEFRPANGWDLCRSLGTPANLNEFRVLASLLHWLRATEVDQTSRCLSVSWAGALYIHFWGLLPPHGILLGAKFTLRPNFVFSYIGSVIAHHSNSGHQPNFAAFSRGCHLYSAGRPSRWASALILVVIVCK